MTGSISGQKAGHAKPSGGLNKVDAYFLRRSPRNAASPFPVLRFYDQSEIVRYSDWALDFQTSASLRNIPHDAIDSGCVIKRDRPALKCSLPEIASLHAHVQHPSTQWGIL
jgi:hypothetical protein